MDMATDGTYVVLVILAACLLGGGLVALLDRLGLIDNGPLPWEEDEQPEPLAPVRRIR